MNERIKELDAQAVEYAVGVCDANGLCHYQEYLQVVKEKFAELIVRECANWIESQDEAEHPTAWLLCDDLKEHFGVKE